MNLVQILVLIYFCVDGSYSTLRNRWHLRDYGYFKYCIWDHNPVALRDQNKYLPRSKEFCVTPDLIDFSCIADPSVWNGHPLASRNISNTGWNELAQDANRHDSFGFTFDGFFFYRNDVYGGETRQLLGCPVSLCLSNGVDYLNFKQASHKVYAQLGHYEWQLTPSVDPYLSEINPGYNENNAYTALNFPQLALTIFLKDKTFNITREHTRSNLERTSSVKYEQLKSGVISGYEVSNFQKVPTLVDLSEGVGLGVIDAGTVQYYDGSYQVYLFHGQQYSILRLDIGNGSEAIGKEVSLRLREGYPDPLSDLDSDLRGIDEIFLDPSTQELYIFKNWVYTKMKVIGSLEEMLVSFRPVWKSIHKDLFQCTDSFYTSFTSKFNYATFKDTILKNGKQKETVFDDFTEEEQDFAAFGWSGLGLAVFCIILGLYVLTLRFMRKISYRIRRNQ